MANTEDRIKQIVIDILGLPEGALLYDTKFKTAFDADSLDIVELMVAIEKEFNIAIPDEQIERIQTVRQVADYVNKTRHFVLVQ
jgi:acyl carrier protein